MNSLLSLADSILFPLLKLADKKSDLISKFPDIKDDIEEFASNDPSGNLKYLSWQVKMLVARQAPTRELIDIANLFHRHGQKLEKKDIYAYRPEEVALLRETLEQHQAKQDRRLGIQEKKREQAKNTSYEEIAGGSKTVYEGENCLVKLITNKTASVHLGNETDWCISRTISKNYFNDYDQNNVIFFFLLIKGLEPENIRKKYHKIALVYQRDKDNSIIEIQFFDSHDTQYKKLPSPVCSYLGASQCSEIVSITRRIAEQQPKSLIAKLASRETTEAEELKIYQDINEHQDEDYKKQILQLLVKNTKSPTVLSELAKSSDAFIRERVSSHHNTPPEILAQLTNDEDEYVRRNVARNTNTPPEILAQLANDQDENLRYNIAINSNTSPEILAQLANDKYVYVRQSIAENRKTPPQILAQLANDEDELIRRYVAKNPNTPPEILAQLANDQDEDVRYNIARNTNTPPEILPQLASDKEEYIHQGLAKTLKTPPQILAQLAKDESEYVRGYIAENPNTPPEILAQLANDKSEYVRKWVAANPNTPPEIRSQINF